MALFLVNSTQAVKQHSGVLGIVCLRAHYSTDKTKIRPLPTTNLAALKRGTGGRSSFNGIVATVFGCTGFVGRYVVNKLGKHGTQMILPYRADFMEAQRLKVAGDLGQVLFHFIDLRDEKTLREAVKYSNVVINLIGRDWETKNYKFKDVHVDGARRLAKIAREAGVERFIHLSALNADPNPKPLILKEGSGFLKSKYYGECAVREEFPNATIIRPSDIYGQEDRFLRFYAHGWRRQIRAMPLWYKGERTYKQPVFVNDIAQGILNAVNDPDTAGKVYQAVGPRRYQLGEMVDWFYRIMRKANDDYGYVRYDMRWDPTFMMKVRLTELICPSHHIAELHRERIEREYVTDIVDESVPTLEDLGVNITKMEDQVPWELRPFRHAQYYDDAIDEFEKPAPPKYVEKNVC